MQVLDRGAARCDGQHHRTNCQVVDKVTIAHVDMDPVGAGFNRSVSVSSKACEIRCQDRRRDDRLVEPFWPGKLPIIQPPTAQRGRAALSEVLVGTEQVQRCAACCRNGTVWGGERRPHRRLQLSMASAAGWLIDIPASSWNVGRRAG